MLLLACLTAGALGVPPTAPAPRLPVVISTSETRLPREQVRAIADEARRIWAPVVDLDISLPEAGVPSGPLVVIVADRPLAANETDASALGAILFASPRTPVNRVVLSVAGAERLAAFATWRGAPLLLRPRGVLDTFVTHALGRALAHEIGHFLLRSPAHESAGLMRAQFSAGELVESELWPYALTRAERREIATRFADRTASASIGPADRRPGGRQ